MKRLSRKGQAITSELAVTALLTVVFCILGFDMFFVIFGFSRLDSAARDAARAAGGTGNATLALQAAQYAAKTYTTDGYFVTQPQVIETGVKVDPTDPAQLNYYGVPNAADFQFITNPRRTLPPYGSPWVSVTTRCKVKVPVPINFFGAQV